MKKLIKILRVIVGLPIILVGLIILIIGWGIMGDKLLNDCDGL